MEYCHISLQDWTAVSESSEFDLWNSNVVKRKVRPKMGRHAGSPCSIWHYHCMHPCSKLQCGTGQITLPCRFRLQYEPVSHPYQMLVFINLTLSPTGVESISVGRKHHCIHNVLYMFRHFVVNFRHKMWTSVCYFTVCQLCLPNEYFKVYALNVEHYL